MARKRVCTKCGYENDAKVSECGNCAVLFRDVSQDAPKKFAGHDSNPNDPICQSCGSAASIYPGALRGGGKGYCSDCFRKLRSGKFSGVTEHGSETAKDLRAIIAGAVARLGSTRRTETISERVPGEDDA